MVTTHDSGVVDILALVHQAGVVQGPDYAITTHPCEATSTRSNIPMHIEKVSCRELLCCGTISFLVYFRPKFKN